MRRSLAPVQFWLVLAGALLAAGCGSARTSETVEVELTPVPVVMASGTADAPTPTRMARNVEPASVSEAEGDSPEDSAENICDIDPGLCALRDPKLAASCGCDKGAESDRTKCMINCAARERQGIEKKLRSGRY